MKESNIEFEEVKWNNDAIIIKNVLEEDIRKLKIYENGEIYLQSLIKRKLLDLIPDDIFFNATDFMDKLIEQGYKVIRYPISGYWFRF